MIALILLTVLNETMGISFLIPAAQCDFDLSTRDKGLMSSMTFLGEKRFFIHFSGDFEILFCDDNDVYHEFYYQTRPSALFQTRLLFLPRHHGFQLWGFLGDTQGRRIIILYSLFFSTTFTLLSVFMKSFTLFVICRFVTGVL
jgi:MFS transporter, VNT family, synaptic vesicle glycoprotein 2